MKMLTVIPTPIGNIADISQRSIDALGSVDTLLCESISNTKKLYQLLGISMPKLVRFWQKMGKISDNLLTFFQIFLF